MNNGAFGENFPYSNFHDLNMDWIIKIAKDFLDQYTHIQDVIASGEQSLNNLTEEGLAQLQRKADDLETALNAWYQEHSEDIANQLTQAISDLQAALATAENDLDVHADEKLANTLANIPSDYTELSNQVNTMNITLQAMTSPYSSDLFEKGGLGTNGVNDTYRIESRIRTKTFIKFERGITITSNNGTNAQIGVWIKNSDGTYSSLPWGVNRTLDPGTEARIQLDDQFNSSSPTNHTLDEIFGAFTFRASIADLKDMVQPYDYALTNGQLEVMNVTYAYQLPVNRVYTLQNVNLQGLPSDVALPVNGSLIVTQSTTTGWKSYILILSTGETKTGISTGTSMRWDSGNKLEKYGYLLNDSRLNTLGITTIEALPRNKIYSVNNVSVLTDLPANAENPFNGALVCFGTPTNGWPMFILINNYGSVYFGTSSGTGIRWDYSNTPLTKQISGIIGKRVVLVGDSIMYGSHMSDAGAGSRTVITIRGETIKENTSQIVWTYGFKTLLENTYNCTVLNQSFPGCSFNDVSNNLTTLIPDTYDYAIIMLGVNDWGSPSTVKTHIGTISLYCKLHKIIPIFITPYPANNYVDQLAQIRLYIKTYVNEVADFYTLFTEYLEYKNISLASILDDPVHYNDAGQPHILKNVIRALGL